MSGQHGQIQLAPRSPSGVDQQPASGGLSVARGLAIFLTGVACGVGAMVFAPSELPWSPARQAATTTAASVPAEAISAAGIIEVTTDASDPSATATYVVQPGDSLVSIANRFGVPLESLAELNGITDPGRILVGQDLLVPGDASVTVRD